MEYNELLNQLESQRKVIQKRLIIGIAVTAVTTIIGLIAGGNGIIFGLVIGFIVAAGLIADSYKKYKELFKKQLMPLLIAKTGINLTYDYKRGIAKEAVLDSKLFKRPDRYRSEDLMSGSFDDVSFICSDVLMQERHITTDSKGRVQEHFVTFFSGRWFIYDFNKEFNGIIQVREDGFLSGPQWGLSIQKISLEDVEFNKKFKTYATNQHDAFYVLTPSLMENIKLLEKRFPGRIYFSFIGTELHIGIYNSKNSFEPPVFQPLDDKFINEQIQDIVILKEIVHELRLNRKIFKE